MSDKWAVIRVSATLRERLDAVALRLERAYVRGQVQLEVSDRWGVTDGTVIDRLLRHYEGWRRRKAL